MTNNIISTTVQLFLCLLSTSTASDTCDAIKKLGTPSLDRFDPLVSMDVDADCEFTVKLSFKHDETLPIPSDPATQCNPSIVPPEIASDELPYFAFRWNYGKVSEDIKKVTGIDHISIDWNPCGHPPLNIWAVPHYDVHIYLETPEFRTCMTCDKVHGAPICDPTPGSQTTASGLAFFNVSTFDDASGDKPIIRNMPAGFVNGIENCIPLMGGHSWDHKQEPSSGMEWVNPIWIMGPYNGGIIDYEPMIPMEFCTGEIDKSFSETLSYEDQTMKALPNMYTVAYNGTTGITTLTLEGSSADKSYCETKPIDKTEPIDESKPIDENKGTSSLSKGVIPTFSIAFIVALFFF